MATNVFRLQIAGITKTVSLQIKSTNLVLYGSGYSEPVTKSHNAGQSFEKIAKARHKINQSNHPNDNNEIFYCPTDIEFFELINNRCNINRLDVYCHGWVHGINLGGFEGKRNIKNKIYDSDKINWLSKKQDEGKDLRRVEMHENVYLKSTEKTELIKLNPDAFSSKPKIYFWGCNVGGQLDSNGKHVANNVPLVADPKKTFAQEFAKKVAKGNVYTLVGKSQRAGSMFKTDINGKNVYSDGEMLPANISKNNSDLNTITINSTPYLKEFPL